jgi:hypothetical protein
MVAVSLKEPIEIPDELGLGVADAPADDTGDVEPQPETAYAATRMTIASRTEGRLGPLRSPARSPGRERIVT